MGKSKGGAAGPGSPGVAGTAGGRKSAYQKKNKAKKKVAAPAKKAKPGSSRTKSMGKGKRITVTVTSTRETQTSRTFHRATGGEKGGAATATGTKKTKKSNTGTGAGVTKGKVQKAFQKSVKHMLSSRRYSAAAAAGTAREGAAGSPGKGKAARRRENKRMKKLAKEKNQGKAGQKKKKKKKNDVLKWTPPSDGSGVGLQLQSTPWYRYGENGSEEGAEKVFCSPRPSGTEESDTAEEGAQLKAQAPSCIPVLGQINTTDQRTDFLSELDRELSWFASYVRLTREEVTARQDMVNRVQAMCDTAFRTQLQRRREAGQHEEIRVVTFGSFASPDVCTYASDVDMAVWGVVDPPPTANKSGQQEQLREGDESRSKSQLRQSPAPSTNEPEHAAKARRQRERVRIWHEAILDVTETSSSDELNDDNDAADANVAGTDQQTIDESPPFVVDRFGVSINNPIAIDDTKLTDGSQGGSSSTGRDDADDVIDLTAEASAEEEESGNDDADKMAAYAVRRGGTKRSGETTLADDFVEQPNVFEVSFVSTPDAKTSASGPSKKDRKRIVSALYAISKLLRADPLSADIDVRRRAKVPIIAFGTHFGVDGDISIGGHALDTSAYAMKQIKRFRSFAPVVLFLKVLLRQAELDKPFTGGLGSYKLYVLVAYHIDRHIANGGADCPSEILVSFLHRFSDSSDSEIRRQDASITALAQDVSISFDGGVCDLMPVFKIHHCVKVFGLSHERIASAVGNQPDTVNGEHKSLLAAIIDAAALSKERQSILSKAKRVVKTSSPFYCSASRRTIETSFSTLRKEEVGHNITRKRSRLTSETEAYRLVRLKEPADNGINDVHTSTNDEAEKIMAGYGLQEGPGGTLIPLEPGSTKAKLLLV